MLVARFFLIVACLHVFGCSTGYSDDVNSSSDAMNTRPRPPVVCDETRQMACDGRCVNIAQDIKNCGFCGVECNVRDAEICYAGQCLSPVKPTPKYRPYDIRKDLARPPT